MAQKSLFKDILEGVVCDIWEDGEMVFVAFPWITLTLPKEEFELFKNDMKKLILSNTNKVVALEKKPLKKKSKKYLF